MADREYNIGIIGCGTIARFHADAIKNIHGVRLAGATDTFAESRKAFAAAYSVREFVSVDEMLGSDDIDIVNICTPSGLHAELAIRAAQAGKHIVVEKPMALTLEETDEVIKAVEANKVKMAVISQLRFYPAVIRLKEAILENKLGRLVSGDVYMKYYRSQEYYDKGGWRGTWKMDGGGALMNQGIHGIDLLLYMMGPVKSVFAYTRTLARKIEVEDTAAAVLEFRSGAIGVIQGTTSVYPGSPRRLEICGDRGTIVLEEDSITSWNIEGQEPPADLLIGHTGNLSASDPTAFSVEGHTLQIADMADAIRHDRKPMVDQYDGRKPIELIMAIYESSRTGKPVELKQV